MANVNDDPEYVALKSHVKGREIAREVWGALGTLAFVAAVALPLFLPTVAITGAIATSTWWAAGVAGVVSAFSGWKAFRADQDVRFDTKELESRREGANLARALGNAREQEVATAYTMARASNARSDGKSWADAVQAPEAAGASLERH